ncbi:hypothetical protein Dda_1453 [Drechslerella dactyloides]|uniref:Pyridoxal phosphate homeostasis protein n=1 Tax=Drechslerella dactyloides TaxID=74499 RepID=A0AAD6J2G8_DREDA|nr:hypothetical protein Dda_1453 [Drechslerella dactyloides]
MALVKVAQDCLAASILIFTTAANFNLDRMRPETVRSLLRSTVSRYPIAHKLITVCPRRYSTGRPRFPGLPSIYLRPFLEDRNRPQPRAFRSRMSDIEADGLAAAEVLAGLQARLRDDAETQARAHELAQNVNEIRERMAAAAATATSGRQTGEGLKPAMDILALHAQGQDHFGENYVQELAKKQPILPLTIRWHFIGSLQSSAISKLARIPNLHAIHSIDSAKKAISLNRLRPDDLPAVRVFIQVNTSGEESKSGLPPSSEDLYTAVQTVRKECSKLILEGLMTIGAIARSQAAKEGEENEDFITLVNVAEELEARIEKEDGEKVKLKLSMGMSDDFEGAIGLGADYVRVGSSIFGSRPAKADATIL